MNYMNPMDIPGDIFMGGQRIAENFYYPQAGTNFMAALSIKF